MSLLRKLLGGKDPPLRQDHPLFGTLLFSKHDGWRNPHFTLWGYRGIELLLDSKADGPSRRQEEAFRKFEGSRTTILPRCLEALAGLRRDMSLPPGDFAVTGLTVPSFTEEEAGTLWTLWFDCRGDDDFWYGVQSDDDWQTVSPFADD